jgi:hypothetical protein
LIDEGWMLQSGSSDAPINTPSQRIMLCGTRGGRGGAAGETDEVGAAGGTEVTVGNVTETSGGHIH